MKSTVFFLSTLLSLFTINSAFSAQAISSDAGKVKIGVVSASGATTLDELVVKLANQADKEGASSFKVISATGNNKLHGVAEIYK
jgi:multiple stress resistance protein BhsA